MKEMFFDMFRNPSDKELAQRQLEDAKRELLAVRSQAEHARKMTEYYEGVVKRLSKYEQEEVVSL